jgi:ParB/RepB/Spo0J family partition protein
MNQIELISVADIQVLDTALRETETKDEKYMLMVEDLKRGNGIHSPIFVVKATNLETGIEYYELVDGLHRLSASKEAKLTEIPAIVYPEGTPRWELLGLQIRANTLRIPQKKTQVARQYERIMAEKPGLKIEELAKVVGQSVDFVRDALKFSSEKLDEKVITLVESGTITLDNARELSKAGKKLQNDELIQAAQVLKTEDLKNRITATKQALAAGEKVEPAKPKEPKVFEAKFKARDRAVIMQEIEAGDLAKALYNDPALQEAFTQGVKWGVSLDEDTVSAAREEFERKQQAQEELRKQKELEKHQKRIAELNGGLEPTIEG